MSRADLGRLRHVVHARQRGRCAATGLDLGAVDAPWHLHHRRPGGRGGTTRPDQHTAANLVAVIAEAHNMGSPGLIVDGVAGRSIHTDPLWSKPLGLLLSSLADDVASHPVRVAGSWGFLLPDGGWLPI